MTTTPEFLRGSDAFYASAAARRESERTTNWAFKMIDRANEVSIFDVLQDFFDIVLPRDGESYKTHCPFGAEHEDGGRLDKGWRTYPATNSSYCFPMHGSMPPVRLVSLRYGERHIKSAERILDRYGLLKPKHYKHRMTELLAEYNQSQESGIGNPQHAVEALHHALRQVPSYEYRQFDDDVMTAMGRVLSALDKVVATGDPELLRTWFARATTAMTEIVQKENQP